MIKIRKNDYECNICNAKEDGVKEVGIYKQNGDNIICIRLCPHCMQRMAQELMLASIGENPEKLITDDASRKIEGHSKSIIEEYYHK